MAQGGSVDSPAHGAPSSFCRTPRLEKRLVFAAALLYLAVCSDGCWTSDSSNTQKLLQIPPWSLFRKTQCPPAPLPALFGKRSQQIRAVTAPCTCDTKLTILDLGPSRLPRYLPSVDCLVAASECSQGILCKQLPYKVRVLRRRHLPSAIDGAGEEVGGESEDDGGLPESLRSAWRFEKRDINIACECQAITFPSGRP